MGKIYFTSDVESAIIKYNNCDDSIERMKIYERFIHRALNKLVENVIHKFKFYAYESTYADLKHDTVAFLHERLKNYTQDKGKAFSYFTIITRNYLIARSKETQILTSNKCDVSVMDDQRIIINEVVAEERRGLLTDFFYEWTQWGNSNIEKLFQRERDRKIANAVFDIFTDCNSVENFNKKALYILIREHAGVKTQYITKVVNRLREMFADMMPIYIKSGTINWDEFLKKYIEIDIDEDI